MGLFFTLKSEAQCSFTTPVTFSTTISGSLSGCTARYYKYNLNATACSTVTFDTCGSPTSAPLDTVITVYNPSQVQLASNDDFCNLFSSLTLSISGYSYVIIKVVDFNNGISGNYVLKATITSTTTPQPTASAQTFCSGTNPTVANLVATGTALNWYSAATGGTPLTSTTALTSATYYVTQTLNSCESARTAVVVSVVAPPPTASAQSLCLELL